MSNTTTTSRRFARSERSTAAADRWQLMQARLSPDTPSDASHWTRRSFVTLKWRAPPAGVSAVAPTRMNANAE